MMTEVPFSDAAPTPAQQHSVPVPAKAPKTKKGDILPLRAYALQCKSCDRSSERGKTITTHWDRDEAFRAREEHFAWHKAQETAAS